MDTQADKRYLFLEGVMLRLRQHFIDKTPLPDSGLPMTLLQLQRLYEHIIREGYGE